MEDYIVSRISNTSLPQTAATANMELLSLPDVMIENILSYLRYDEIAKLRQVSTIFNYICSKMLNRGFMKVERKHSMALKSLKAKLPRRESERREHPFSRHCDILNAMETRISMLSMTFLKYIDNGICCFIPGKIIDEIYHVLKILEFSKTPPRTHEVLQELRDLSSMAIEHFDDKISPSFRSKLEEAMGLPRPSASLVSSLLAPASWQDIQKLRRRSILSAKLSLCLASEYKNSVKLMHEYKITARKNRQIIKALTKKQRDQDSVIAELKQRIEIFDAKFCEIIEEVEGTSGLEASTSSQQVRHVSSQIKLDPSVIPIGTSKTAPENNLSNIKPRNPVIRMPSLSDDGTEPSYKLAKLEDAPPLAADSSSSEEQHIDTPKVQYCTEWKIVREIASEIRNLSGKIKLKRPSDSGIDSVDAKKNMFE